MKKPFKILARAMAMLFAVAGLAAVTVYWGSELKLHRHFAVVVSSAPVAADAAAIERGRHIAITRGCLHCHGEDLAGGTVVDNPMIGKICGPNLTRGLGGLPENFGNEDWVRAIRHGVGPGGRPLVIMPAAEFTHLSDDDFGALLAFLTTAPRVDRETVPVQLGPVGRLLVLTGKLPLAADLIDHATVRPSKVVPGITKEYGGYLAANCMGCHGPNLSGGKIHGAPPEWPPASNLTTISDGPLGHWTETDFIVTLRTHRRPNGVDLNEAMPRTFGQLTDDELKALWIYLRSVPPATTGQHGQTLSFNSSPGEK